MQKGNPVIKNYIYVNEALILKDYPDVSSSDNLLYRIHEEQNTDVLMFFLV